MVEKKNKNFDTTYESCNIQTMVIEGEERQKGREVPCFKLSSDPEISENTKQVKSQNKHKNALLHIVFKV